jgi:hypothetical protein
MRQLSRIKLELRGVPGCYVAIEIEERPEEEVNQGTYAMDAHHLFTALRDGLPSATLREFSQMMREIGLPAGRHAYDHGDYIDVKSGEGIRSYRIVRTTSNDHPYLQRMDT